MKNTIWRWREKSKLEDLNENGEIEMNHKKGQADDKKGEKEEKDEGEWSWS